MMTNAMACSASMMIGMAVVSILAVATLVLISAAAIKYLRSGAFMANRSPSPNGFTGGR